MNTKLDTPAGDPASGVPLSRAARTRLKVLFLVTEDRFFWSHRLPVARAARDKGFEVIVATRVDGLGDSIRAEGFRLIPLQLTRKARSPLRELRAIRQLRRIYTTEKPDLVHHFALKPALYGSLAVLGHKEMPGINALTGLGFLVASRSVKATLLRPLLWKAFRILLNRPDQLVVVENADDRQVLVDRVKVNPEKITIVRGSGVDVDAFPPAAEPSGTPVVLLASRMLWMKGVGEFVEAARLLRAKGVAARFVLAGDSDASNPTAVPREQLLKWQAEGVVEWWGHQDSMSQVFAQANLTCLPSHGGEGVPQVLMEAAASGRAIITTDVPGCRDVVQQDVNGIVIPAQDAKALAAATEELLGDPVRRHEMGRRGREIAVEQFSQDAVIRQIMGLYASLTKTAISLTESASATSNP